MGLAHSQPNIVIPLVSFLKSLSLKAEYSRFDARAGT
jgi:hypothetical protein